MGEGTSIVLIEEIKRVTQYLICFFSKIRVGDVYNVVCNIGNNNNNITELYLHDYM